MNWQQGDVIIAGSVSEEDPKRLRSPDSVTGNTRPRHTAKALERYEPGRRGRPGLRPSRWPHEFRQRLGNPGERGKLDAKVAVAVARELACFCWEIATLG